ncbi:cardiolipin synthase B [Stutzerimonas xanthomarina]|uniref:cardiolipin synthase ClsB n=1 Tax=Stutzerimonas nitrititolerans TaxID=2482751 RepID=UPI00026D74E0|nr:cardiolipin synthase ClsB [Stutzerimonas nitrititolerans]AFN77983.1 cardiolipin synthase 2 [Stutzerimonas stutzeri DSM 10701]OCX15567.1 cardiolipin synthase B [Stutzerimonas xanthomarina]RRV22042.1 cardiolipin synthase ClsB [Pseudomonas sp. s199]HBB79919.1 cardiolipin synthase ClsB [Pseudomonas sp.]NNT94731.1 cardiolipin synthase ClsB [Stutzerimonas nitrititolerans]
MKFHWRDGNRLQLLENGEEFFPRVFEAIREAKKEVLLETFIFFEDKVGIELQKALIAAAQRGASVDITVDGYGSADLSAEFVAAMTDVGIRIQMFDPRKRLLGKRVNLFRRLHRKIVVVDGEVAFIGGINFSADHLGDFGPGAKQDYALQVEGPVVHDIHRFALTTVAPPNPSRRWWQRRIRPLADTYVGSSRGEARALLVTRDNDEHNTDIEQHYLQAIRDARSRLVIANAYFFPGYRVLREIRNAARRGVRVRLILQGQPDMPIAKFGARMLYNYLMNDGVEIHEYCRRPLHGKVALADYEWSTVGSSNLDPLSLSLNLEANLIIRDHMFNRLLHERLDHLLQNDCRRIPLERIMRGYWWRAPLAFLIFHFLRHFPALVGMFPAHKPKLELLDPNNRPAQSQSHQVSDAPLQREQQ